MTRIKKKIIARRADGFILSLARPEDYPKLIEFSNNLSDETKQFWRPWFFKKKSSIKNKIGQTLIKISLNPTTKNLMKNLLPFFYAVFLIVENSEKKIVGIDGMFNFKRLSNGKFMATSTIAVAEKFQSIGITKFMRHEKYNVARKENVQIFRAFTRVDNQKMKNILVKQNWKYQKTLPRRFKWKGKLYDSELWTKNLEN